MSFLKCDVVQRARSARSTPLFADGGFLRRARCGGWRVADAGGEVGEIVGEVFELGEFGEPFVGRGEVLDAEIDAGAEGVGVFGGDGVGADEFHLFDQALLLGADERQICGGLVDAVEALAESFEAFEAGGGETLFGVEKRRGLIGFFGGLDFGGE